MEKDSNYQQAPYSYLRCLQAQCPRAAECLRFQAASHASVKTTSFFVVNPIYIAGKEKECPHFQEDRLECFALGITQLYDAIPYVKVLKIRRMLQFYLHRSTYYRIKTKKRYIHPEEQSLIRDIFRKEGIKEEPVFDELVYKYDW
ncbi:hypothetical protein M2459_003248 [Parabacteroides sp. PF5-5]|uniref:DUF6078 family protein n=1 Tax=unclassified Parabacteroides TaxID=2649774 RepID=UPI002474F536|nr:MULTISPECIES: DUF6078 family protein [unclassified Parabacteroides]MDH6306496.1 hypothetical protein [Parabacteroides sp. PH5-39]MDH6317463.1 hypothetical protein [Parabacteroides sp. PF5-13]MDH6321234.1 hypothetical protein [Parabacteroides sp. PH5-13]MDH6324966.1 hypothetical protein [Parabacteroides sp. PH5-8]MDH6328675.1 hypothetical protein [Parabacteroides sp. PH5-41]